MGGNFVFGEGTLEAIAVTLNKKLEKHCTQRQCTVDGNCFVKFDD
jgi:hypothetical protein